MTTKRVAVISDVPAEGLTTKRLEVLLSPSHSDIESQIACVDPLYVEQIRKGIESQHPLSKGRLRELSISDVQRRKSLKDRTAEEAELGTLTRDLFGEFTDPLELLSFFRSYDPNMLTDTDMDNIKRPGSTEMFDLLQSYQGWMPGTLDALRDEQLNMNEFAELLLLSIELEKATNAILENAENTDRILDTLRERFSMLLKPLEILHLFHKYDPNVLVQEDLDAVTAVTLQDGDKIGSNELLDRLVHYHGWYPCLMKVLRDSSVGLAGLADELANLISEEFEEIKACQQKTQAAFMARVSQIKERAKEAKKLKRRRKTKGSTMGTDESSGYLGSEQKSYTVKKSGAWDLLLNVNDRCPKYPGLDWNRELAQHCLDHLPTEIESANQRVQLIFDSEKDEAVQAPGLHERMLDPWAEGEKYAEKYALTELLTFMLTRLILDTPSKPVDYLIDLAGEINRLDTIRQQVDELTEAKKRCEMEAAQKKSSAGVGDLAEKTSVASQNASTDTAPTEMKAAEQSESAKLTEFTDYTETTDITETENISATKLEGAL